MSKQLYLVTDCWGNSTEVETSSLKAAINRRAANVETAEKLVSVVKLSKSIANFISIRDDSVFVLSIDELGVEISAPTLSVLNQIINRLGYKSVRETSNMLNADSPKFFIDADTPSYCDPGCESYHSM